MNQPIELPNLSPAVIGLVIAALVILYIFSVGYIKAKPDEAIIISGIRKKKKALIGKAGIRIPFLERKDSLSLQLIPIDVKTSNPVPTADYININVDATVNVKIGANDEFIKLAAQNFLNRKTDYISHVAREVLEGNVREIVGKMKLEEMVSDRQKFATLVKENAEPDLAAMGLEIISFNVQNFIDSNQVIENLGIDNVEQIRKKAAIAKASASRDIAIAEASADREANEAKVKAETDIAERQNALDIKKAELKAEADQKNAVADAAYKITEQEQRKAIDVAATEADIAKQVKQNELREKEVEAQEQILNAQVRKQADAEKYAKQQAADAQLYERQRDAEAKKFEVEKDAEAKKTEAEAKRYAAEQEATAIKAKGVAEAEAVKAKGLAEAEAIEKKADAMQKYGEAAKLEMIVNILPQMAEAVSKSIGNIDKLTVIDSGNGSAVNSVGNYAPQLIERTVEAIRDTTGFDLTDVMAAKTKSAMTDRNVSMEGIPSTVTVNETFAASPSKDSGSEVVATRED